jgi:sugar phosphate permease
MPRRFRPAHRVFYGWWIVGAGVGVQALVSGLQFQAFGTYIVLLENDFGWSRTSLSAAFSLAFGPRWVMRVGFILFGLGFLLFSRIDSLAGFYATFALMSVGAALAGFLSVTTAVANWFRRRRTFAMGLTLLGTGLGGLALPGIVWMLENHGWRNTAALSGVLVLVVGLPLTQVIRHRPEPYGYLPDGDLADEQTARAFREQSDAESFTAREALRTGAFWLISLAHASAVLVVSVVTVHFVAHVNGSLGYSLAEAAAVVTVVTVTNVVSRIGGGWLGDRFNARYVLVGCLLGHALALLILTYATALWMILVFAVLHGGAWGVRVPVIISMRADYFGAKSYGMIMGMSSMVIMAGSILGPLLAGISYDVSGNYRFGFTALAILAAAGSLFIVFARRPVLSAVDADPMHTAASTR